MTTPGTPTTSRRTLLAGAAGLAVSTALSVAALATADNNGIGPTEENTGPWTFTDDRGRKLDRDKRPKKLVAYTPLAAGMWDYGIRNFVGVFGPSSRPDGSVDPMVGAIDLGTVMPLTHAPGEFVLEQYRTLQADVLLGIVGTDELIRGIPAELAQEVEAVAPTAALRIASVSLVGVLEKVVGLARSLGADVDTSVVNDARTTFNRSDSDLVEVARTLPGIRVLAVSGTADGLAVAVPDLDPTLKHLVERGVNVVVPGQPGADGAFERLPWAAAGKYPADLILYDTRTAALGPDQLRANPAWAKLPAVVADQLVPWSPEAPWSYQGYTPQIGQISAGLRRAKPAG